jgi:hypothetical protein
LPVDDPIQRCPDISQAKRLLDWQPHTQLDTGLMRTIAYFDLLLTERGESSEVVDKKGVGVADFVTGVFEEAARSAVSMARRSGASVPARRLGRLVKFGPDQQQVTVENADLQLSKRKR